MSITSLSFVLFAAAVYILYFALPARWQWCVLLAASTVFYLSCGVKSYLFVLITSASVYCAARWMGKLSDDQRAYLKANKATLSKEEKSAYKASVKKKRKALLVAALVLNFGLLCFFKYFHFTLAQINWLREAVGASIIPDRFSFIVPLGISFYTFQSTGYLVDVYWEHYSPEKNYGKVLLFTSFFPQITQGPISDFEGLSRQLFAEHTIQYEQFALGGQRMIWGFLKKMVVANSLAPWVQNVFAHYSEYSGISTLIGAFLYSIQIYADFSGYMDIMCGFCQMLGITLTENFMRPYFSKSVAEYWRRWHISLGVWFKKYIYYPIGMSPKSRKLGQICKKRFGRHFGDTLPASIALVVTWLATGLWHGASWAYITWGLVNGLFIILSLWMEPLYVKCRTVLRLEDSNFAWRAFRTIRTFLLVTFIKVLPEVGSLSDGLGLWRHAFTNTQLPGSFRQLLPFISPTDLMAPFLLIAVVFFTGAMLAVSLAQRKGSVRARFNRFPLPVRLAVLVVLTFVILSLGVYASMSTGGFMYENF